MKTPNLNTHADFWMLNHFLQSSSNSRNRATLRSVAATGVALSTLPAVVALFEEVLEQLATSNSRDVRPTDLAWHVQEAHKLKRPLESARISGKASS